MQIRFPFLSFQTWKGALTIWARPNPTPIPWVGQVSDLYHASPSLVVVVGGQQAARASGGGGASLPIRPQLGGTMKNEWRVPSPSKVMGHEVTPTTPHTHTFAVLLPTAPEYLIPDDLNKIKLWPIFNPIYTVLACYSFPRSKPFIFSLVCYLCVHTHVVIKALQIRNLDATVHII